MSVQESPEPELGSVKITISYHADVKRFRMKVHLDATAQHYLGARRVSISGSVLEGLLISPNKNGQKISVFSKRGQGFVTLNSPSVLGYTPPGVTNGPLPLTPVPAEDHSLRTLPLPREHIDPHLHRPKPRPKSHPVTEHALATLPVVSALMSPDDERKLANAVLNINEAVKKAGLLLTLHDGLLEAALPVKWRKLGS